MDDDRPAGVHQGGEASYCVLVGDGATGSEGLGADRILEFDVDLGGGEHRVGVHVRVEGDGSAAGKETFACFLVVFVCELGNSY